MGKKLKDKIEHCGECPHLNTYMIDSERDTHYCGLTRDYVSMNVDNKTIHENCKLEED